MEKNLRNACLAAIIDAALEAGWNFFLNHSMNDILEMLDDSEVTTPAQAVIKFRDLELDALDRVVEAAEQKAGWDPNP